jgi:hypothetical protein
MDSRRGRDNSQNEGGWLLVGRDPRRPPSPDSRDDPSALLYEAQKVAAAGMRTSVSGVAARQVWLQLDGQGALLRRGGGAGFGTG